MNCLICNDRTREIFTKIILKKHKASYLKCEQCGFVSVTPSEQWLDEAYSSAITSSDLGLLSRNNYYAELVERLLLRHFDVSMKFLDYAGGYGVFTRLMRDKGFNYYHEDPYCENLFATNFQASANKEQSYELVTAFEFMEHTPDPMDALRTALKKTDSFLFSTEIIPEFNMADWSYLATETGQHISLYTIDSLRALADQCGRNLYTNGRNLHLITSKALPENALRLKKTIFEKIRKRRLPSLLPLDYEAARKGAL